MKLLDIVVTHYNEPFSTGKKFFDMLALQRGISFDDIRVIVINDGSENALSADIFTDYPFDVEVFTIDHAGVSAARNAGIEHTSAKWVNFCDFDDIYASVYSLRSVLNVLEVDSYDLLYANFISEFLTKVGKTILLPRGQNTVFIHAKYWRREWLIESGLRFNPEIDFCEDSEFCAIAANKINYRRIGRIETEIPIYVWCFRPGSATTTPGNRVKCAIGSYERNKKVVESFKELGDYTRFCGMVSRTIHDAYWNMNLKTIPGELRPYIDDFKRFWAEHKQYYFDCPPDLMREVADISRKEHDQGDKEAFDRGDPSEMITDKSISLSEWLFNLEKKG